MPEINSYELSDNDYYEWVIKDQLWLYEERFDIHFQ